MGFTTSHDQIIENWHLTKSEVLGDAQYLALAANETRKQTGCDTPSIEFSYDDLDGEPTGIKRFRLADATKVPPGSKPRKYTGKKGDPVSLFLPRGLARGWRYYAERPDKTIYITEGEAKALYATLRLKIPCIAVQGCSGWQAQDVPAEQFGWFDWTNRKVIIIPDSDYRHNGEIRKWFAKLGKHLASKGARVSFRLLPDLVVNVENPGKSKTGLDDWAHLTTATVGSFRRLPTLPLEHPWIQEWDGAASRLPEALRNLKSVDASWYDEEAPPVEYILQPYLQTNETAQVAGQAGVSKSTWLMYAAAAMATATPFFGIRDSVTKCHRVMYCMLERHKGSFHRRWRKIAHHIAEGLAPGEQKRFRKNLIANSYPLALAGEHLNLIELKHQQWILTTVVDELIAELKAAGIQVLIFDPLSRLHGGDEDTATMSALTRVFERIVQQAGCSVMFVHHAGITARGGKYAGRGSSTLTDNTSETISVEEYIGEERNELGDLSVLRPGEENADIIQVEHTRCSDGPLGPKTYFVRLPDTGLLRPIAMRRKDACDMVQDLVVNNVSFHQWAEGKAFTKNELVTAREVALGSAVSERDAKALFVEAVKSGAFRQNGKRGRGELYEWARDEVSKVKPKQLGSLALNSRATAQLKTKEQNHAH
jgi:hypothetical protein